MLLMKRLVCSEVSKKYCALNCKHKMAFKQNVSERLNMNSWLPGFILGGGGFFIFIVQKGNSQVFGLFNVFLRNQSNCSYSTNITFVESKI